MDKYSKKVEIEDEDQLLRRIHPNHWENGRILSIAFYRGKKPDPEVSVDVKRLIENIEDFIAEVKARGDGFRIGILQTIDVRNLQFQKTPVEVVHDPEGGSYSHALIKGAYTKTDCRLLAEAISDYLNFE